MSEFFRGQAKFHSSYSARMLTFVWQCDSLRVGRAKMRNALDRRDVMALAAVSALAGCTTGQLKPEPLPTKVTDFVDVHCHIFNAADVPAAAFIVNVAAREYGFADYKYLVAFFVALLAQGAPSPEDEGKKLGGRN